MTLEFGTIFTQPRFAEISGFRQPLPHPLSPRRVPGLGRRLEERQHELGEEEVAEVVHAEGELEAVLGRRPLVLAPVHPGVVDQDVNLDA